MPRPKILIVDDIPENIKILGEILREDYKIIFAVNGQDALKLSNTKSPPSVILLDIMMPNMDGYQVCRKLKDNEKTSDIPVIFVTANTDDSTLEKAFDAGGTDYVRKPVNRIELMARVKSALTQRELVKNMIGEEKLKGVIEMAGGICHELNQPIQTVSSYSELLMMKIPEDDPAYNYGKVIKRQIDKMGAITRKLMRITRYETTDYLGKTKIIDINKASGNNPKT